MSPKTIVMQAAPAEGGLERSNQVLGNLLITLSVAAPASSVFTVVPGILFANGSGGYWR